MKRGVEIDKARMEAADRACKDFAGKHRQYVHGSGWCHQDGVVGKVWNGGRGIADLYRVHPVENVVYAARGMFTKCDERHLADFINMLNAATGLRFVWQVVDAEPYPDMRIRI